MADGPTNPGACELSAAEAWRAELERIKAEISAYPRPIAGCDAQFNHLLEKRTKLESALNSVKS